MVRVRTGLSANLFCHCAHWEFSMKSQLQWLGHVYGRTVLEALSVPPLVLLAHSRLTAASCKLGTNARRYVGAEESFPRWIVNIGSFGKRFP